MTQRRFYGEEEQQAHSHGCRSGRYDRRDRKGGRRQGVLTGGLDILAHAEVVTSAAPAPRTLVDIAQDMQSYTSFACFAFEGQGATLFLKNAVLIFEHCGDKLMVVEANDKRLVGVFIWFGELRKLAEAGEVKYFAKIDTKWPEDLENKRVYVLTSLLEAIAVEGGHEGVMTVIQSRREAAELREAMASRSQNLLDMFDAQGTHTIYAEIGGKPMVFRSGHFDAPSWKAKVQTMRPVFGVKLMAAPLGTPEGVYKVGTYVLLEHLFSLTPPSNQVGAMMSDLCSLFEAAGLTEQVKAKVVELGGVIPEAEPQGEAVVVDDGMVPAAAEHANACAMQAAVHGPSPVAQTALADLVVHAALVEAEG